MNGGSCGSNIGELESNRNIFFKFTLVPAFDLNCCGSPRPALTWLKIWCKCNSFHIYTRLLIFGMNVLCGSSIGVAESNRKYIF